jgi:hypothetical protein
LEPQLHLLINEVVFFEDGKPIFGVTMWRQTMRVIENFSLSSAMKVLKTVPDSKYLESTKQPKNTDQLDQSDFSPRSSPKRAKELGQVVQFPGSPRKFKFEIPSHQISPAQSSRGGDRHERSLDKKSRYQSKLVEFKLNNRRPVFSTSFPKGYLQGRVD